MSVGQDTDGMLRRKRRGQSSRPNAAQANAAERGADRMLDERMLQREEQTER